MDDNQQQQDTSVPQEISSTDALPATTSRRMPTTEQLAVALGILLLIFGASYIRDLAQEDSAPKGPPVETSIPPQEVPVVKDNFEDVSISATAAYVWDVKNQRALYNKNAGTQMPLASVTKLMTALVAYEMLGGDTSVTISEEAVAQEGDSGLAFGNTFTLESLSNFTLVTSSNDGAYALALAAGATRAPSSPLSAFIEAMNEKAEALGLSQSYFSNPTGLDVDGAVSGSYGSARDMAFLMEYLVLNYPELLEETREKVLQIRDQQGLLHNAVNTNEIADDVPGLLGSKTGFTDLAGGNLVVAYDAGLNRPIIISVLGSTREGRFNDIMTLIERTTRTFSTE